MKVALAFSGGLDTTYCAVWLREQGHIVHTITVNTGGFTSGELQRIETVASNAGVESHSTIDGRQRLFDQTLRYLIYGNVLRGQAYPLSVSAERIAQAILVVERARELGCEGLAHGSTGAGNDQVRFDVAFRALAPSCAILTPIRDQALSRADETSWLAERGIEIPPKTTAYSINEGMWGTSIGGRETLTSHQALPEEAFPTGTIDPQLPPRTLRIAFERGIPTELDDVCHEPVALIEALNRIGGPYGIGRGMHLGDTILGIKGRIGFEAPAAAVILTAHRELEKLVLSGKQLFWKEQMGNLYGALLHEGHCFDPLTRDVEAFLESSQRHVTGFVDLELRPYSVRGLACDSPHSLMNPDVAAYGESNRLWSGDEAAGFAKLYGIPSYLAARVQGADR